MAPVAKTAAVLAVGLVERFRSLGGPYFVLPETVQDHVQRQRPFSADAIVLCRRAAPRPSAASPARGANTPAATRACTMTSVSPWSGN